jgi:hypothetical protein
MTAFLVESAKPRNAIERLYDEHIIQCMEAFEQVINTLPDYTTDRVIQYTSDITPDDDDMITSEYTLKTKHTKDQSQITVNLVITDAVWGPFGDELLKMLEVQISDCEPILVTLHTSSARRPQMRNREAEVKKFRNAAYETLSRVGIRFF